MAGPRRRLRPLGWPELGAALTRLDERIGRALDRALETYSADMLEDRFRGLHISPTEVRSLLERPPATSLLWSRSLVGRSPAPHEGRILAWLAALHGLDDLDLDILLVALAPEVDLRYERLYAFLQDDVTRRRPTVDLALGLLCDEPAARLANLGRFLPDGRLAMTHLIEVLPAGEGGLPACSLRLDSQIAGFLLGGERLDSRLLRCASRPLDGEGPVDSPLEGELEARCAAIVQLARSDSLAIHLQGPASGGRLQVAAGLANRLGRSLLRVDLRAVESVEQLDLAFRQAAFEAAVLWLDHLESLAGHRQRSERLLELTRSTAGVRLLAGDNDWLPSGPLPARFVDFALPKLDYSRRQHAWSAHLATHGLDVEEPVADRLAARYRLTSEQIGRAVTRAAGALAAGEDGSSEPEPTLLAAARQESAHELDSLAVKLDPVHRWSDLVVPRDLHHQLEEICQRVDRRHRVLHGWGFDRRLSLGKGVNALFSGPSGTGKTMAAEIVARELGLDLYRIDLSGVVSKYIGETEKNLDRVFVAAHDSNAILFFDEADALFGKRSEVRDSHDRYANIEISYLLQKMEAYEGVTILATNLRKNLDEAFTRRLAFSVNFPMPDAASRRRIWEQIWPAETPLAKGIDFALLAERFPLSGGNIKNIALAAAFLAADENRVSLEHIRHALRREFQKMGKSLTPVLLEAGVAQVSA